MRTFFVYVTCPSEHEAMELAQADDGAVAEVLRAGLAYGGKDRQSLADCMERKASELVMELESRLGVLGSLASVAPFIGLFGTVWGIMHSFTAIAQMKSVSLATVAPGIAEALIATAVGLFVAIPAVCGYNVFRAKLVYIEGICINYAGQLLNRLQHEAPEHGSGISFAGEH